MRSDASRLRVIVADDQELVRDGFRMILESAGCDVVGEAADGREAVYLTRRRAPDVVLMDIRMPGVDGLEATREIAGPGVASPVPVLILTTFDLDEYVMEALRAGASGFLLKDAGRDQLVEAVRAVARGDALIAPSITRRLIGRFVARSPDPLPAELDELTARELEVVREIARGRSNAELARELGISETTVKTHVARVLAKLRLRDRVQIVVFAYEHGLAEPRRSDAG
ncbi:MAG: response regulator transcription factor [Solirubrobacteraceae bacterium]